MKNMIVGAVIGAVALGGGLLRFFQQPNSIG